MQAGRVLVVAVLVAGAAASVALATPRDRGAGAMRAQLAGVNFISACRFSHRASDDPIMFPRRPGVSHNHSFVGNASTNAFSTVKSLRRAASTCRRDGDTAAYWTPTLFVAGTPVAPQGATIYYRRRTTDAVLPFPAGLRMIAGDMGATSPQSLRVTFWNCGAATAVPPSSTVPTCPAGPGSSLRLHVNFPDCWNGRNLDSPDHQSHMAYSVRGSCPASHPVAVPAIALIYRYPVAGGADAVLASGGQYSGHADFFNAWRQGQLTRLVNTCLNALRHCARGD
jgi:hypothetical protein